MEGAARWGLTAAEQGTTASPGPCRKDRAVTAVRGGHRSRGRRLPRALGRVPGGVVTLLPGGGELDLKRLTGAGERSWAALVAGQGGGAGEAEA
jgi:hypothetical protein